MHWIDVDVPGGSIVDAGKRQDLGAGAVDGYSMKGNTVMFDIGKILKTGGAPAYGADYYGTTPARQNSFIIDINGTGPNPTPTVTFTGNMNLARTMHNSTVLPTGEVLITADYKKQLYLQMIQRSWVLKFSIPMPLEKNGVPWQQ
ncbi:hypothetical protein Q2T40_03150 [Winogradskyella maritima]|nr:hypothetical protein [Winogradskyella maritima]